MKIVKILLICLLIARVTAAETKSACRDDGDEKVIDCFNRLVEEAADKLTAISSAADKAKTETDSKTEEMVKDKLATSMPTDGAATLRSFLPQLLTSAGFSEVSDEDGVLSFEYNLSERDPGVLALRGTLKDAEVFEPILMQIPEDMREDQNKRLSEGLGDFDDFELEMTWSPNRRKDKHTRWGRNFANYQGLFTAVFDQAPVGSREAQRRLAATVGNLGEGFLDSEVRTVRASAQGAEHIRVVEAAALEIAANHNALRGYLDKKGFFRVGDLVSNQPQFYVTGKYRYRDDVVGPDEWSVKASYERGWVNVNKLHDHCSDNAQTFTDAGGVQRPTVTCLQAYLTANEDRAKQGSRVKAEVEVGRVDELMLDEATHGIAFSQQAVDKMMGSVSYGRYLQSDDDGNSEARLDVEAKYEHVDDDADRNRRFVATATVSRKLPGDMSLSIGAVYANKPEYRGDVDKELSALLGLKFKLDREKDSTSN